MVLFLFLPKSDNVEEMKAADYVSKVVEVVSDLTGIDKDEILGRGKAAEVVDARWMVVKLVREAGYYPAQIAKVMGMSVRHIQAVLAEFGTRMHYFDSFMRSNYEEAAKLLRSN